MLWLGAESGRCHDAARGRRGLSNTTRAYCCRHRRSRRSHARARRLHVPGLARRSLKGLPGFCRRAAGSLRQRVDRRMAGGNGSRRGGFQSVDRLAISSARVSARLRVRTGLRRQTERRIRDASWLTRESRTRGAWTLGGAVDVARTNRRRWEQFSAWAHVGGRARAKAVLAWNPETCEFRAGQWTRGMGSRTVAEVRRYRRRRRGAGAAPTVGVGRIEYAYH